MKNVTPKNARDVSVARYHDGTVSAASALLSVDFHPDGSATIESADAVITMDRDGFFSISTRYPIVQREATYEIVGEPPAID